MMGHLPLTDGTGNLPFLQQNNMTCVDVVSVLCCSAAEGCPSFVLSPQGSCGRQCDWGPCSSGGHHHPYCGTLQAQEWSRVSPFLHCKVVAQDVPVDC